MLRVLGVLSTVALVATSHSGRIAPAAYGLPDEAPAPKAAAAPSPKAAPQPSAPKPAAHAGPDRTGAPSGARLKSVLSEMRQELQAGSPEGDPLGDASEAEGDQYQALVVRALRQNYRLPSTLSDKERLFLTGTLVLHVDGDGRIISHEFEQRSGNAAFDEALERAVRDTRLPPPPAPQRDAWRRGVHVQFKI